MLESDIPPRCKIYLFGPLTVFLRKDDDWIKIDRSAWGSNDYSQNVLKRLLAAPGRRLSRGKLIEEIWPGLEEDSPVENYLDQAISRIRRVIGKDLVITWKSTYQLAGQEVIWTDADEALSLLKQVENREDRGQAVPLLEKALALLERGDYLEREPGTWCYSLRGPFERRFKQCRLWLAQGYEQQGKYLQASLQYEMLLQDTSLDSGVRADYQERLALVERQARSPTPLERTPQTLYVGLDPDILALAWRWQPSFGSIAMLQQIYHDRIRNNDMTNHVTRRQMLEAIIKFPLQVQGITLFSSEIVLFPSVDILPLCAAGIAACWELRQYEAEGMQAIQQYLATYLPALEKLARQSSLYQQSAAYLAAQGYLLVSLLTSRQSKLGRMEAASRAARFYAQIAQDANLEVSALTRLAVKFELENRDTQALETYQEAITLPGFPLVTPLLQSRSYAGLAYTYAFCQQTSKALSYLSQAKEIYPTDPEADPSYVFAFHSRSGLTEWEGLTLERTHHYTEAIAAFSQFGRLTPLAGTLEANRSAYLKGVASVAVKQRDLDQAALYLDTAEDVARDIRHVQRQNEVRETLQSMQRLWPDEPKVKRLQEKILAR